MSIAFLLFALGAEARPVHIEWKAHDGCPSLDSFRTLLVEQGAQVVDDDSGTPVRVELRREGASTVGTLTVGAAGPSEITGTTCDEVVQAIAFSAALALEGAPKPPVATVIEKTEPVVATRDEAPAKAPKPVAAPSTRISVFGGGQMLAPGGGLYAYGPEIGLAFGRRWDWTATLALTRTVDVSFARMSWMFARFDGCPVGVALASDVMARGCIGATGGVLTSEGADLAVRRLTRRPWITADAVARLELGLGAASVRLEGGISMPFVRDELVADDVGTLYRPAAVSGRASATLALRFP